MKLLIVALSIFNLSAIAQNSKSSFNEIVGIVLDSLSKEPIPFAQVKTETNKVLTDFIGFFKLQTTGGKIESLSISALGYKSKLVANHAPNDTLRVYLETADQILPLKRITQGGMNELNTIKKQDSVNLTIIHSGCFYSFQENILMVKQNSRYAVFYNNTKKQFSHSSTSSKEFKTFFEIYKNEMNKKSNYSSTNSISFIISSKKDTVAFSCDDCSESLANNFKQKLNLK